MKVDDITIIKTFVVSDFSAKFIPDHSDQLLQPGPGLMVAGLEQPRPGLKGWANLVSMYRLMFGWKNNNENK